MIERKPLKAKSCRFCRTKFVPRVSLQAVCSPQCAAGWVQKQREKIGKESERKERAAIKAKKEKLKTRSDWAKEAQQSFNAWVRARDIAAGYGCISCGTKNPNIQYAAGHYRTVAAAPQHRFNPDNVHLQCNHNCNSMQAGNIVEYRIELVKRIGLARVEAIENDNAPKKYDIAELKAIRDHYRALTRELKKEGTTT